MIVDNWIIKWEFYGIILFRLNWFCWCVTSNMKYLCPVLLFGIQFKRSFEMWYFIQSHVTAAQPQSHCMRLECGIEKRSVICAKMATIHLLFAAQNTMDGFRLWPFQRHIFLLFFIFFNAIRCWFVAPESNITDINLSMNCTNKLYS